MRPIWDNEGRVLLSNPWTTAAALCSVKPHCSGWYCAKMVCNDGFQCKCFSSILHFISSWCIFLAVALHFERHLTLPFTPPYPWSSTMHISYQPSENWVTFLYVADICHLRHPQCWRTFFKIAYNSTQGMQKGLILFIERSLVTCDGSCGPEPRQQP